MGSKPFSIVRWFSFLILFPLLCSPSYAVDMADPTTPLPPETICKVTPYPSSCTSILPRGKYNVYDSGRFSIRKSLLQSVRLQELVEKQLQRSSSFTLPTIRALLDCKYLASQNVDFLSSFIGTVDKTNKVLSTLQAENIQTLLTSTSTNLQTCLEGLQSTSSTSDVDNEVLVSLSNDCKLHSVSLALFEKGWKPKRRDAAALQPRKHPRFRDGPLPLRMSDRCRAIYEKALKWRRKLIQEGDAAVVIRDIVVVSQEGWGNFTTINEAINAAPNNSVVSDGYFLIYVAAGEYQEYVSVESNKKYLFLLGNGIGQTIITGNRSVVDGWTTFNSATFGKVF